MYVLQYILFARSYQTLSVCRLEMSKLPQPLPPSLQADRQLAKASCRGKAAIGEGEVAGVHSMQMQIKMLTSE